MGNTNNYHQLEEKVTMYLDNDLSKEAEIALLKEIRQNPAFKERLGKEQSFRDFLKSKIRRRKASPALIQSIKDKIRVPVPPNS